MYFYVAFNIKLISETRCKMPADQTGVSTPKVPLPDIDNLCIFVLYTIFFITICVAPGLIIHINVRSFIPIGTRHRCTYNLNITVLYSMQNDYPVIILCSKWFLPHFAICSHRVM